MDISKSFAKLVIPQSRYHPKIIKDKYYEPNEESFLIYKYCFNGKILVAHLSNNYLRPWLILSLPIVKSRKYNLEFFPHQSYNIMIP